jgi:large subunit ribosomal protein L21
VVADAGNVVAAAMMTPPHLLVLSRTEHPQALGLIVTQSHAVAPPVPVAPGAIIDTPARHMLRFPGFARGVHIMYAVIEAGGKQVRVEPGQVVEFDRVPGAAGTEVTLGPVLMIVDGEHVTCGAPEVVGARVAATVLAHTRSPKVLVGKFRSKKRYRRRVGHRQPVSRVRIERIDLGEGATHGA